MTTAKLWIEIVISGFFYLLACFFLVLKLLGINSLCFLSDLKDYFAFLSVGVIVVSYLFGVLAHRLESVALSPFVRFIENRILRKEVFRISNPDQNHNIYHVKVFQYGSARLNHEIDFHFSTFILLRSLVVSLPFLGLSFVYWIADTTLKHLTKAFLVFSLILFIGFFISFIKQRKHYIQLRETAFREVAKIIRD